MAGNTWNFLDVYLCPCWIWITGCDAVMSLMSGWHRRGIRLIMKVYKDGGQQPNTQDTKTAFVEDQTETETPLWLSIPETDSIYSHVWKSGLSSSRQMLRSQSINYNSSLRWVWWAEKCRKSVLRLAAFVSHMSLPLRICILSYCNKMYTNASSSSDRLRLWCFVK